MTIPVSESAPLFNFYSLEADEPLCFQYIHNSGGPMDVAFGRLGPSAGFD